MTLTEYECLRLNEVYEPNNEAQDGIAGDGQTKGQGRDGRRGGHEDSLAGGAGGQR